MNVPAHIALDRAYLAQLRGDAEGTAAFSSRALAESSEGEQMLNSIAQGFLAVAEWLRGRLAEAEHALVSSIDGWRVAGQLTMTAWGCHDRAKSSEHRAAWTRPSGPASRHSKSPHRPAGRLCQPQGLPMWN